MKSQGGSSNSAGSFEASDKAKAPRLPRGCGYSGRSGGDIANALRSLPGAQPIGDREGLFVQGGSSEEAKQFVGWRPVAGSQLRQRSGPAQPSRLNPFLFKGILFSTGGYSAYTEMP